MLKTYGMKSYKMIIDGQEVGASDGATFESLDPSTGQPWATIPEATEADVDRAVHGRPSRAEGLGTLYDRRNGQSPAPDADVLADHSEAIGRVETAIRASCWPKRLGRPPISLNTCGSLVWAPIK